MNILKKLLLVTLSLTTAFSCSFVTPSYASQDVTIETKQNDENNDKIIENVIKLLNDENASHDESVNDFIDYIYTNLNFDPTIQDDFKKKLMDNSSNALNQYTTDDVLNLINNNIDSTQSILDDIPPHISEPLPTPPPLSNKPKSTYLEWLALVSLVSSLGFTTFKLVLKLVERVKGPIKFKTF